MSAKQLRGDFALGPAVATAEEAEPEVAPPSEGAPGAAIGTLIIYGFAALGDDTVLSILLHLAVNGQAQAVANVSLCSRRLKNWSRKPTADRRHGVSGQLGPPPTECAQNSRRAGPSWSTACRPCTSGSGVPWSSRMARGAACSA